MTSPVNIPHTDWVYDIETYLDLFSAGFVHAATRTRYIFEVSERIDQSRDFVQFIYWLRDQGARLVGFNNEGFDWPVCQSMVEQAQRVGFFTALDAHSKGTAIITSQNNEDRWSHGIWPRDRIVPQVDLFKIHHFDNKSKSTSLKKLEINMRSKRVVDLPYPPDQVTTSAQKDEIIAYMCHDISDTLKFYVASLDAIRFRDELAVKYPTMGDVVNMNDTKIGKQFFIMELEAAGVPTSDKVNGRKQLRQTKRDFIRIADIISPKVSFRHPDLDRVKNWLASQTLTRQQIDDALSESVETKGVFKNLSAVVDGFQFDFGTGGIHGSLSDTDIRATDEWEIWDWDVESFYPNLGITNRIFPAHLSEAFCDIYQRVFLMRKEHKKGTAENAMLKLALNGVYGDSNNKYSPFYDSQYTMSITLNGQLLLCMLAEWLVHHPWQGEPMVRMIQANTDGITLHVHKSHVEWMHGVCKAWQQHTGLTLESVRYDRMIIRDVNSYIAVKSGGKGIKRIGAYAYQTFFDDPTTRERQWHQDHSMLVVRKAAEAHMLHGVSLEYFIMSHRDPFDFQLSVKVPRSSRLMHGDTRVQNTTRYYVSTNGAPLTKIMPPLKGKTDEREMGVDKGWTVTITNDMADFSWENLNWFYYIQEARKLVIR